MLAQVRYELVHVRKLCKSDELFIHKAEQAISNILPCFSGVHDHCRRMSFTCNAHLPTYSTKFLPYGGTWTWNLKTFPAYRGSLISRYWAKTYQKSADSQLLINVRVSIRQCSLGPETSPHCVTLQFIPLLTALDLHHLSLPTRSVCAGTMQDHSTGR